MIDTMGNNQTGDLETLKSIMC